MPGLVLGIGAQRWIRLSLHPVSSSQSRGRCAINYYRYCDWIMHKHRKLNGGIDWKLFSTIQKKQSNSEETVHFAWTVGQHFYRGGVRHSCRTGGLGQVCGGPEWQHRNLVIQEVVDAHWRCWSKKVTGLNLVFWTKDRNTTSLSLTCPPLIFSVLKVIEWIP